MNRGESEHLRPTEVTSDDGPAEKTRKRGRRRREEAAQTSARKYKATHKSQQDDEIGDIVITASLIGGGTALLPVPFVDERFYAEARKLAFASLFDQNEAFRAHRSDVERLLVPREKWWEKPPRDVVDLGRWFFYKFIAYPARKIARKVLYFLAIRDCTTRTCRLFHESYLLHYALQEGLYDPTASNTDADIDRLKLAIGKTIKATNMATTRALFKQLLHENHWFLARAAMRLPWMEPTTPGDGSPNLLEETASKRAERQELRLLISQMREALWHDRAHLTAMEQEFQRQMHNASASPSDEKRREPQAGAAAIESQS